MNYPQPSTVNVSRSIRVLEAAMTHIMGNRECPSVNIWHAAVHQNGATITTETVEEAHALAASFKTAGSRVTKQKYAYTVSPQTGDGVLMIDAEGRPELT